MTKLGSAITNIREEICVLDGLKEFEGGGADERATAEGGAVNSGRDTRGYGFTGKDGAKGQTGGQGLGD